MQSNKPPTRSKKTSAPPRRERSTVVPYPVVENAPPVQRETSRGDESEEDRVIARLVNGTDDEREEIVGTLRQLPPDSQGELRGLLRSALVTGDGAAASMDPMMPRDPGRLASARGWLLGALAHVAGADKDARDILTRHLDPRFEPDERVRYWTLASVIRTRGLQEATSMASRARQDPSDLVRALATAIADDTPDTSALERDDRRAAWACLRALQIVSRLQTVPPVVAFLKRRKHVSLAYDGLLVLTSTGEMTAAAGPALAGAFTPQEVARLILQVSTGARPSQMRRFAGLLQILSWDAAAHLREVALSSDRDVSLPAHALLGMLAPQPLSAVPPGDLRLEIAYRGALARPGRFELLESLSVTQLAAVAAEAGGDSTGDPAALHERLKSAAPGGPPNPLWIAWMKTVHAAKLTQT